MSRQIHLRLTWRYLAAFAALTILCGTSHEFAHHFAGAAICGAFGTKTFNSFELAAGCQANPLHLWSEIAGPALTFGLMWWGVAMLRGRDDARRRLGLALIFANFPINRLFFVLIGANDEQWVAHQLYGQSRVAFWVTVLLVWAVALPPVVIAVRALGNRPRALWAGGFVVLPFAFVVLFAGLFLENYLLLGQRVLATSIWGVPYLIVLTEVLSLAIYGALRPHLAAPAGASPPAAVPAPAAA
jgi:hypothetical protein